MDNNLELELQNLKEETVISQHKKTKIKIIKNIIQIQIIKKI